MQQWEIYIIRCRDFSLYTGIASNAGRRLAEHRSGGKKCAKYLRGRGPLKMVWRRQIDGKGPALSLEKKIKKLAKQKKEMLVKGKFSI